MPIFNRGQEIVAKRCSDVVSRHLYGEALTTASENQKFDIVESLLESNVDFDLEEITSTLDSICAWGSERTLQSLLQHDTKEVLGIKQYSSGLDQAARKHNRPIVLYWLEEYPDHQNLVVEPATVIHVARNGFIDILLPLIERIMPMDSFEKTLSQCLQVASSNGHEKVVEYLIREGAKVNAAVEKAREPFLSTKICYDYLFGHDDTITRKRSALQAALTGTADASSEQRTVELLLGKGADPNGAGEYGRYPLNIAAGYCTVEVVQVLISSGADVETVTEEYGTALQAATRRELRGLPIIKTLLEASGSTSSLGLGKAAALNEALSFFGSPHRHRNENRGRFELSTSIADVLSTGPGAVVKVLLANLPEEKSNDARYGLLAQMACIAGDQECVKLLVKRGMDVNILGSYYGTALQAASRVGNIEIADYLLKSGAEVNLRYGDKSHSVLHLARESRNQAIFETLLNARADVNTEIQDQQHILIVACEHGDTALVELLLANGVDVSVSGTKNRRDIIDWDQATPLHAACTNCHLSVVQLLLDSGADVNKVNKSSITPLTAAIRGKKLHATFPSRVAREDCRLEIVQELLRAGAIIGDPSTEENALARACDSRQYMVAEVLLAHLSSNEFEAQVCSEALSAAIKCGDDEMVLLLLEHGVSPSFEMLREACVAGVLQVVKMLVDTGIDVNRVDGDDAPLLHVAASHLRSDIVRFLINRGTDVTHNSTKYGSPLIAALEGSQRQKKLGYKKMLQCEKIVEILFDAGAKVDTIIREFGNALHLASYMGSDVIVRQLLERMEDVNIFGGHFETALIAGLKGDHPIVVDLLLDRGIEVNRYSPEHGFALHCACRHGSRRLIQNLLDHGANINAYNDKHGSALTVAVSRFCRDPYGEERAIMDLLLHHEPKVRIRECDLLAAASGRSFEFISLFLRHDPSVVATEAVIVKVIKTLFFNNEEILPLLLRHDDGLGTTPGMVLAAVEKPELLKILLEHKPLDPAAADIVVNMSKRATSESTPESIPGTV